MNDWQTYQLSDIAEVIMGQSPTGDTYNRDGLGTPLLNGPTEFGSSYPTPALWTNSPTKICEPGDLLFCVRGSTTGRMNWADRPYCLGRGIGAIRGKRSKGNTKYVYYTLCAELSRLLALCSGSVFPNLSRSDIAGFEVAVPTYTEQRAIAHVLGALDDKIELNRRMNATLEEMARTLFRSWFVDFEPFGGVMPSDWRIGTIRDLCIRIENGGTPSRKNDDYWMPSTIPWLTSGEVRQSIVLSTENHISEQGYKNSSAKLWDSGTTVVALYGATAGQVCYLALETTANQACCGLVPKEGTKYFIYLSTSSSIAELEAQARGSAQQNLSQDIVAHHSVIVPTNKALCEFNLGIEPLFQKWIENGKQSQTLAQLRDTILPKLISGEVRLPPDIIA